MGRPSIDDIIGEGYEALANAIIIRAMKDYKTALKHNDGCRIYECERFFRGQYIELLTGVKGEVLMNRIQEEVYGK